MFAGIILVNLTQVLMRLNYGIPIALLLLAGGTAGAGTYRLDMGRGVAICEAYERNLLAVAPKTDLGVYMPQIIIQDRESELRSPTWKRLGNDPMPVPAGVDLDAKVDAFIWERGINPAAFVPASQWPQWRGTPEQLRDARRTFTNMRNRMYSVPSRGEAYALLDIDNDGIVEPVYADNQAVSYGAFAALLIVLRPDFSDLDKVKTERLLLYPPRPQDAAVFRPLRTNEKAGQDGETHRDYIPVEDAMRDSRYDVLLYRDKAYVTAWGFDPAGSEAGRMAIHVYRLDHERRQESCAFRLSP